MATAATEESENVEGNSEFSDALDCMFMNDLECHFTWHPEKGGTKINFDDLIKNLEDKMKREPHMQVVHLATIAYLSTRQSLQNSFDYLQRALDIHNEAAKKTDFGGLVTSEYVIRADMLFLNKIKNPDKKPSEEDFENLRRLFKKKLNKAQVFGVKGETLNCFGPTKCHEAMEAYSVARKFEPHNFYWLFGEAKLMSRCARTEERLQASPDVDLQLWDQALKAGLDRNLIGAMFYANYAEAILYRKKLKIKCQELADKSYEMLQTMTESDRENAHGVYMILLKVYRHLQPPNNRKCEKLSQLFKDALEIQACARNPDFYLLLSYENENLEEAIKNLLKAREFAVKPGHIWVELRLLHLMLESGHLDEDKVENEYSSLKKTFSGVKINQAAIEFDRALYLMKKGDVKNGIEACIAAEKANAKLRFIEYSKKSVLLQHLHEAVEEVHDYHEYLAWYLQTVGSFGKSLNIEDLYKIALDKNGNNTFALENIGKYYLGNKEFQLALQFFRRLPTEHKNIKKLIAEAALLNPTSTVEEIFQCLKDGCIDAAQKLLSLLKQERDSKKRLYFDRSVYEKCSDVLLILKNVFFVDSKLKQKGSVTLLEEAEKMINELFQFDAPQGTRSQVLATLRSELFEMTQLHMSGTNPSELAKLIVSVLTKSKDVIDQSFVSRTSKRNQCSYPHAFDQIKLDIERELPVDREQDEVELLIQKLKDDGNLTTTENLKKCLQKQMIEKSSAFSAKKDRNIIKNFYQNAGTRNLFDFMVRREQRILSSEHGWIIRWIYFVSSDMNEVDILVQGLNDKLRSDWSGAGECRSAYDVAHLAAEFAEETWAVFSD